MVPTNVEQHVIPFTLFASINKHLTEPSFYCSVFLKLVNGEETQKKNPRRYRHCRDPETTLTNAEPIRAGMRRGLPGYNRKGGKCNWHTNRKRLKPPTQWGFLFIPLPTESFHTSHIATSVSHLGSSFSSCLLKWRPPPPSSSTTACFS